MLTVALSTLVITQAGAFSRGAHLIGEGPIRISVDEWVVIRNNPRFPAALIRIIDRGGSDEHYRVVTFDLDPARRELLGRYTTLRAANDSVRYDRPVINVPSNFGAYENRPGH